MVAEWAGGSPDVVYFLWSSVTCIPHCQAGIRGGTAQHSLHGASLHGSGSFPRTQQGPEQSLALLRLYYLGAGSRGLFLSFPILLTPRGSFRTAVLNPLSTVTHDVLMQDTLLWTHPNYEATLPKKNVDMKTQSSALATNASPGSQTPMEPCNVTGGDSNTTETFVSVRLVQLLTGGSVRSAKVIPVLQMEKLKHREVKALVLGHMARVRGRAGM